MTKGKGLSYLIIFPLYIYVNLLISNNHLCNRRLSILYLGKMLLLLKHLSLKKCSTTPMNVLAAQDINVCNAPIL